MIKFDCYLKNHKLPQGAAAQRKQRLFCVKDSVRLNIDHVNMIVRKDSLTHTFIFKQKAGIQIQITIPLRAISHYSAQGFHRYRFELVKPDGIMCFAGTKDGHSAVIGDWLPEWQILFMTRILKRHQTVTAP